MKTMAAPTSPTETHTTHCARRMITTTLRHKNENPLDISQPSGHKNLKSIDSYSIVSEEQQMFLIISDRSSGRTLMKPVTCKAPNSKPNSSTASASSNQSDLTSFFGVNQCTTGVSLEPSEPLNFN